MKRKIKIFSIFFLIFIGLYIPASYPQLPNYTMTLTNNKMTAPNVFEFDIYLLRTDTSVFQLFGFQIGLLYDTTSLRCDSLIASWVPGSNDSLLLATYQVNPFYNYTASSGVIKIDPKVARGFGTGAIISNVAPGTRIGRLRLTCDKPFDPQKANLTWSYSPPYRTAVFAYDYTTHKNGNITNPANQRILFDFKK